MGLRSHWDGDSVCARRYSGKLMIRVSRKEIWKTNNHLSFNTRCKVAFGGEGASTTLRERRSSYQCRIANPSCGNDPPERLARLMYPLGRALDGGSNAVRVGDVHREELGPRRPAELLDQLRARILVEVEDGDVPALLVQLDGCCAAEAGCPVLWYQRS